MRQAYTYCDNPREKGGGGCHQSSISQKSTVHSTITITGFYLEFSKGEGEGEMNRGSQRRLRPTGVGSGWGLGIGGQARGSGHGGGFADGPGLGDRQGRQTGGVRYTAGFVDVQGFG